MNPTPTPAMLTAYRVRAMSAGYTPERIYQGAVQADLLAAEPTAKYITVRLDRLEMPELSRTARRAVAIEYAERAITMVSMAYLRPLWKVASRGDLVLVLERQPAVPQPRYHEHSRDEHCDVGPDGTCRGCGATHALPCPACRGAAYHRPGCALA